MSPSFLPAKGGSPKLRHTDGPELEDSVCAWLEDEVQKIGAIPIAKATRLPLSYALGVLEDMVAQQADVKNEAPSGLDASTVRKLTPVLKDILKIEENLRSQWDPGRNRC